MAAVDAVNDLLVVRTEIVDRAEQVLSCPLRLFPYFRLYVDPEDWGSGTVGAIGWVEFSRERHGWETFGVRDRQLSVLIPVQVRSIAEPDETERVVDDLVEELVGVLWPAFADGVWVTREITVERSGLEVEDSASFAGLLFSLELTALS